MTFNIYIFLIALLPTKVLDASMQLDLDCKKEVKRNSVFDRGEEGNSQIENFNIENCVKIEIAYSCKEGLHFTLEGVDTVYSINHNTETFLHYKTQEQAEKAYARLKNVFKNTEHADIDKNLFDFFKPGKVICLRRKAFEICMYAANACANPKQLESYLSKSIKAKRWDEMFIVRCGCYGYEDYSKK